MPTGPTKPRIVSKPDGAIRALEKIGKEMNKPGQVKVGLPAGSNNYPDGTSVIMVGAVQEFGSPSRNIPERSYLRSTIHSKRRGYKLFLEKLGKKVATGDMTSLKAMQLLGTKVQGDVQNTIRKLGAPPNAPRTVEEKGSSNPLIDTGHLRQSIVWVLRKKGE